MDRPSTVPSTTGRIVSRTSSLQRSSGSFLPVSIHQPSSTRCSTTPPRSISHCTASVISSSPRADGWMARTASWIRGPNRYTPTNARSEGGCSGFSTRAVIAPPGPSSATPKAEGSSTLASSSRAVAPRPSKPATTASRGSSNMLSPRYMANGSSPRNGSATSTAWARPSGASWVM